MTTQNASPSAIGYRHCVWNLTNIIETISQHLQGVEASLCQQHAYQGLDSFVEIQLHPLLAQAFATNESLVLREVRFPSADDSLPKDTHRQRCDLVILPSDKSRMFDEVDEQVAQNRAVGTLFESHSHHAAPQPDEAMPEDAFWIEVKAVAQFSYVDGVPSANGNYANELLNGPRDDLVKLASDPLIRHGAVLVMIFHEEQIAGRHDLGILSNAILSQDLPMGLPEITEFPISDRGGNAWCTLGLLPVKL